MEALQLFTKIIKMKSIYKSD